SLRQQDNQFELRIGKIARNISREIASPLYRLPGSAALTKAEILIIQFQWNGARRTYRMGQWDTGQRLLNQQIDVIARADLHQLRRAADQLGLSGIGADREVHAGVLEIVLTVDRHRINIRLHEL